MDIELSVEARERLELLVANGYFPDVNAALSQAILALDPVDPDTGLTLSRLKIMVLAGDDRSGDVDGERFFAELVESIDQAERRSQGAR